MTILPGYDYAAKKTAVLREEDLETARELGFEIDESNHISGSYESMQKLCNAIAAKRRKAVADASAKKKKALQDADAVRTARLLAEYDLGAVAPEMVYEYAIFRDCWLQISKPQFEALHSDIFTPDLRMTDTYTTFASFFEVMQTLGAAGFRLVGNNGSHAVFMKQMAKPKKNEEGK